ncbi:MAG: PHP domain-containing protein [Clostridiales Family XIII bacterium]|jgi:predicted metal-dependent phosphoesterase TrpH|nr:PHP domain-containing protein [Clostridiales Family XIII bacterium]
MAMVDLHLHTNMSDGQHPPREVVRLAAERGVSLLSITDHDTALGIGEGAAAAKEMGIRFIPGIEISVQDGRELHMLGYHIDPGNPGLLRMSAEFMRLREERAERIHAFLQQKGAGVSREQVRGYAGSGMTGRPHFARALVESGHAANFRDAFEKYLSTPEFHKIDRPKPLPRHGIGMIRDAGGVAVLAHPALLRLSSEDLEALLYELEKIGLQGLECHYSGHSPEETALCLRLAEKHGLVITGGSDFHGEAVKPGIQPGMEINTGGRFLRERHPRHCEE